MAEIDQGSPEAEHREHRYVGYAIPWFVHLMWVGFWLFALAYLLIYQLPAIRKEFLSPP